MLPFISNPAQMTMYDWIVVHLFRRLTVQYTAATLPIDLPFTTQDVHDAGAAAVAAGDNPRIVKTVPDIRYTYDARKDFPPEMTQAGQLTWMQAGKGRYVLRKTTRKNVIDLQTELARLPVNRGVEIVVDQTPPFIAHLLGSDEQAVFTRVRNAGLISLVLGFLAWPIQGHHRTTVPFGQIEVDEVQAGLSGTVATIAPISGKGGQDRLSWTQALNLNAYGAKCLTAYGPISAPITGLAVRSLGLWRDNQNVIWVVSFSSQTNNIDLIRIDDIRRFKFV